MSCWLELDIDDSMVLRIPEGDAVTMDTARDSVAEMSLSVPSPDGMGDESAMSVVDAEETELVSKL